MALCALVVQPSKPSEIAIGKVKFKVKANVMFLLTIMLANRQAQSTDVAGHVT